MERRALALSLGLHAAVIAALIGFWHGAVPHDLVVPRVTVVFAPGSAGAQGGGQGADSAGGAAEAHGQAASPAAETAAPAQADSAAAKLSAEAAPEPALPEEPRPTSDFASSSQSPPGPAPPSTAAAAEAALPMTPTPSPPTTTPPPKAADVAAVRPPAPHPRHKPAPPQIDRAPPHVAQVPPPVPQDTRVAAAVPAPPQSRIARSAAEAAAPAAAPQAAAGTGVPGPGHGLAQQGSGAGLFGSDPGAGDDWLDAARRRLLAFMKNPNEGREHPHYGTAWVRITVAHDGRVLAAAIDRSSGIDYLDRSALAMVHDASPLPPLPASVAAAQVTFSIPAKYEPGFFERLFQ